MKLKHLLLLLYFNFPTLVNAKEFIIGVEAISYYPLYDFTVQGTAKPSFTKELLSIFFDKHNYSVKFLALPIKRFNMWFIEQGIDFKFPDNARWRAGDENKLPLTFSKPVIKLMAGTYVLKSKQTLSRDSVKKLGTVLGFYPTLWLDKISTGQVKLVEESSSFSIIKHLIYGNIDATNIDSNVIRHNLALMGKEGELVLNKNIKHEVYAYHLSSIKYPEIIKKFDLFLQNNPHLITQLKLKYGIEEDF